MLKNIKQPEPETNISYVRALIRFSILITITSFYLIKIVIISFFRYISYQDMSIYVKKWSRTISKKIGLRIRIHGSIPPEGTLLISNHRSYIDIPVIANFHPCAFLAKKEVATWPLLGKAARVAHTVFVNRKDQDDRKKALLLIKERLRKGISTVIFPEGTSFEGPGILPFKIGSFVMAAKNDINIVPVAIQYTDIHDAWISDDTFISHFFRTFSKKYITVTVAFGPLMKSDDPEMLSAQCWDWIDSTVQEVYVCDQSATVDNDSLFGYACNR